MRILLYAVIAFALSVSAAKSEDSLGLALNLGDLLGSQDVCNLNFNLDSVDRFIKSKVANDDMDFLSAMESAAGAAPSKYKEMTAAVKVAHCTHARRLGKSLGLLATP